MANLTPYLVEKPWGGSFITKAFRAPAKSFGEAWLISTLEGQETTVGTRTLTQHLGAPLRYLVKVIDAVEPLSIQVHPNDQWAKELENSLGKTECWLILDAAPGAGIFLGLKDGIGEAELREAISANRAVDQLMRFYPVKRGDFIAVPAGTIHAIGAGVTLLEVQQASGITYRLWDWNRPGRELHLEKGLKVSDFQSQQKILFNVFDDAKPRLLLKHADFEAHFNQSVLGTGYYVELTDFHVSTTKPAGDFIFVK